MKITSKSHYGVQVMAYLAKVWGHGPLPLSAIAKSKNLPQDYLEQLMMSLRREGLVKAKRGAWGGYRLARSPEKITLREIIQALEGEMAPVSCVSESGKVVCSSEEFCSSKKIWRKIQESFLNALGSVNLKEVVE